MHFNGRFVLNLAQFAEHLGANKEKLISLSKRSEEELSREDCQIGPIEYNWVIEAAVQDTKDELFGLHAGENMNLQAAGIIVQIAHACNTVKQALEYCCEFANLGCSALPTILAEEEKYYKLILTPHPVWKEQSITSVVQTVYGYLAFSIKEYQSITQNRFTPKEIWVSSSPPKNVKEVERVLNCPVKFDQHEIAILFHKPHVEERVFTSDYSLLKVLVNHAQEKSAQLNSASKFYELVKRSIIHLVKPEFPTVEQIAAHLNMSVRTFQRRLKEEGHSYKELTDELRKEFAISYLSKRDLTISEIAYLLGYADSSTFIRSFKRWTGSTPKNFRLSLQIH